MKNISIKKYSSFSDFKDDLQNNELLFKVRHQLQLLHFNNELGTAICSYCGDIKKMFLKKGVTGEPNFREELVCEECGLNNRIRAVFQVFSELFNGNTQISKVILPEHRTPFYEALRDRYDNIKISSSEYFADEFEIGSIGELGVRNEDLTRLTYQDDVFDVAICLEVLEHVPDYQLALKEIVRVMKKGGTAIITVPFLWDKNQTLVRARIEHDRVVNILEPEYHGDPNSDNPCLCFYHFGWDFLESMKTAGFRRVEAKLYWSIEYGYLGNYQFMFIGEK